jgi:hypothetical protein
LSPISEIAGKSASYVDRDDGGESSKARSHAACLHFMPMLLAPRANSAAASSE